MSASGEYSGNILHNFAAAFKFEDFLNYVRQFNDENKTKDMILELSSRGNTPLHLLLVYCSEEDKKTIAEIFRITLPIIQNKDVFNSLDRNDRTLLMKAIITDHIKVVELLAPLSDLNFLNSRGRDALTYALNSMIDFTSIVELVMTPINMNRFNNIKKAIAYSCVHVLKKMIDFNPQLIKGYLKPDRNAFYYAVRRSNTLIFNVLLDKYKHYFGEPTIEDFSGLLSIAVSDNNLEIAKILLDYGSDPNATLTKKGEETKSPMRLACYPNKKEMAFLLLTYGGIPNNKFFDAFGNEAQKMIDEATIPDVKVAF